MPVSDTEKAGRDMKLSKGEEIFATQCKIYGYSPVREYVFCSGRKWRFDFAFPDSMTAVEVEGGVWSGGRHTRGSGYEKDLEKYNSATRLGWKVYRFSTAMIERGEAINLLLSVIFQEDL